MRGILAVFGAVLSASLTAPLHAAVAPDLPGCTPPEQADSGERQRTKAIPVPSMLRSIGKSSLHHFAVTTLTGRQVCIDMSWIETAEDLSLTPDLRFVSFGWLGYESYGHYMIDRAGKGQALETGVAPVFSPSRRFFERAFSVV